MAVLPVVLFHAGVTAFSGGYVGVDVFFVISGFLITGLIKEDLEAGRFSILGFYNRRIRRILPALVFTALLTSVAAFVFLLPNFLVDFSKSLVSVSTFVSNFYFWKASGYFENSAHLRPMLHTWSLAVEEQFYIFMPIAAFLVYRFLGKRWLLIFGLGALASLALSIYATQVGPTANFFLLPTRAWELLLGALLAALPARTKSGWVSQVGSLLGLSMIAWAVFTYDEATPFPGAAALVPCIGTALAIYFAHPQQTFVGRILTWKPMLFIGLISYSLYLVHWPIAVFWRYLTLELTPGALGAAAIIVASTVLAAFSWKYVEQPFRKRGKASNLQVIGVGVAALAVVGGIGAFGWATNGLPGRFPPDALPQSAESTAASWRNGTCFLEGNLDYSRWSAEACVINSQGDVPTLLWGDSFAAHYVPGLVETANGSAARIYQYTAAGCPPVLSYYSFARPNCRPFNEHALNLIDELGVRRVILSARWVDLRLRGLDQLRSTLDALHARGLEVYVIGQSPMFITDVAVVAARTGGDSWTISIDAGINEELRVLSADAKFIDPLDTFCEGDRCLYRVDDQFLYWDYGHFSGAGSARAARAYMPLGATAP
ncbi:MAG: acyltransferase [Hyphomonadaceae bacterium]|nr:acyltransferase [Hyphomonadaceae bacterium]